MNILTYQVNPQYRSVDLIMITRIAEFCNVLQFHEIVNTVNSNPVKKRNVSRLTVLFGLEPRTCAL